MRGRGVSAESEVNPLVGPVRSRVQTLCSVVAAVAVIPAFAIVLGALVPALPVLGTIGTLAESFVTFHIVLVALVGAFLAWFALAAGAGWFRRVIAFLGVSATLGAIVPLVALVRLAHQVGAPLSWIEHLRIVATGPVPTPDDTQLYASLDGKSLYVDLYLSRQAGRNGRSTPVVMIHGGGFGFGNRSGGTRNWDRWLTARGYTVFDVDYRLYPPATWNQAAPDVACALTWMAAHADEYSIAPDRVLLAGQSAGGALAMQVAYGLADGTVKSSCGGIPPQPRAVVALYPPDDLALPWNLNSGIGPVGARAFNIGYIGGSPEQFPDRYQLVSSVFHIGPDSAPTLIAAGEHDHLVPFAGHIEAMQRLNRAGVPNVLIAVPYGDHGYDAAWGSLGSQITRHRVSEFLEKFAPVSATP
jgi:acetyl esterase/lipase